MAKAKLAIELPPFQRMWDNYPTEPAATVATVIGGAVARNVLPSLGGDSPWNTCTIRLSKSFNYAGDPIPRRHILQRSRDRRPMATISGDDGYQYAYRVKDMDYYLQEVYGAPDGTLSLPQSGPDVLQNTAISGQQLLLIFYFQDATGGPARDANHADLWDGANMRYNNVVLNPNHSSFGIKYWEFIR